MKAERREGESVSDLAVSDTCVCDGVPLGIGVLLAVCEEEPFTGVDDCEGGEEPWGVARVGGDETRTAGEEEVAYAVGAAWLVS